MAQYSVVNILAYRNGKLYYSDDDETWNEIHEETITGYPKPNEMVIWFAGPGIDKITAIDFEDTSDFDKIPTSKFGGRLWFGRIKPDAVIDDEPKYTISFESNGDPVAPVDPRLKVVHGGG